jgi:uncharacterized protein YkwD
MKSLPRLDPSKYLYNAAKKQGEWMIQNNTFNHHFQTDIAENLGIGIMDVRGSVIDLLMDENVPSKAHRKNILDSDFRHVACYYYSGTIEIYTHLFIQEFL